MAKKILIAEDEISLAKALKLKLVNLGFEVDVAEDGAVALSSLKKKHYDLILLDLMMPQMDGFAVMEYLQTVKNKPKIFVNSNLSQPVDKAKVKKMGADEYIIKSDVSLKQIVEKINKALG